MVDWTPSSQMFLPNNLVELFTKTANFLLLNSVSKLSYTFQLFSIPFLFLSSFFGHSQEVIAELELKDSIYRQEFANNKKLELDSLRAFYERQQHSVEHKARAEPLPKAESISYLSKCYNFICEHYIISTIVLLFFVTLLIKPILHFIWIVLSFFKKQLNSWFNALPKSLQRFFKKQRRRFKEVWDFIMQSKDGIL